MVDFELKSVIRFAEWRLPHLIERLLANRKYKLIFTEHFPNKQDSSNLKENKVIVLK
jgi:hypothetical protein